MLGHRERMEENGIAPLTWEGKRSAAAAPDAEVVDKPTRRRFSPSYKLRVVEEADRCTEPGEVGRLLRREGLYSSHLTTWRKAVRVAESAVEETRSKAERTESAGGESAQAGAREHSPGEGTREASDLIGGRRIDRCPVHGGDPPRSNPQTDCLRAPLGHGRDRYVARPVSLDYAFRRDRRNGGVAGRPGDLKVASRVPVRREEIPR